MPIAKVMRAHLSRRPQHKSPRLRSLPKRATDFSSLALSVGHFHKHLVYATEAHDLEMAAASISSLFAPSLSYSKPFKHPPSSLPLCFNLVCPPSNPTRISSLRINHRSVRVSRCTFHLTMAAKLEDTDAELPSDAEPSSPSPSLTEATFDIKLPRRSLLVRFTCDACGERTQRTINRVAYERGTVFVQCSGCLQHHKLVDNLGLIVEYDLREETGEGENSSINQV